MAFFELDLIIAVVDAVTVQKVHVEANLSQQAQRRSVFVATGFYVEVFAARAFLIVGIDDAVGMLGSLDELIAEIGWDGLPSESPFACRFGKGVICFYESPLHIVEKEMVWSDTN